MLKLVYSEIIAKKSQANVVLKVAYNCGSVGGVIC